MPCSRGLFVALLVVVPACGGGRAASAPLRSPTLDYRPASAQTSDGEVVGADRQSPDDKLATGAHAGSGGPTAATGPGSGKREPSGYQPPPPPCKEIGLEDANGKSRCPRPSAPGKAQ